MGRERPPPARANRFPPRLSRRRELRYWHQSIRASARYHGRVGHAAGRRSWIGVLWRVALIGCDSMTHRQASAIGSISLHATDKTRPCHTWYGARGADQYNRKQTVLNPAPTLSLQ